MYDEVKVELGKLEHWIGRIELSAMMVVKVARLRGSQSFIPAIVAIAIAITLDLDLGLDLGKRRLLPVLRHKEGAPEQTA